VAKGELIAVVDSDLTRRVAAVEALREAGFGAFGVGSVEQVENKETLPAIVLAHVDDKVQLEQTVATMSGSIPLVGTPLFVVSSSESNVDAKVALTLGAVDFVDDEVAMGELCARIETRLRRPHSVVPPAGGRNTARAVLELTQALSSTLELRTILFTVVKRIAEVIAVDRVSIVLLGDDKATAYVIAASDDASLRDLPIELDKYPEIQRVIDSGIPYAVEDASTHRLFELARVSVPTRFRSLVLFPIMFENKPMGVVFLRFCDPRSLDDHEDFLLRAIANATGIALRNATLLSDMQDESRRSTTAKAEAEKRLQRYVAFFDSTADGILVVRLEGEVLFCNPAACVILGRSEQELRDGRFEDILAKDGLQRYQELRESFETGIFPNNIDLPIRTGDDRRRVLNVSFSSLLGVGEGGIIISLRDVTEDRALARELTKTKEFLQRVIDSSVDAIVSADMRGKLMLFNPAAEIVYGYVADEVLGKRTVQDLYPAGVAMKIMRLMRSEEHGPVGVLHGYKTVLLGKGGERIPVTLSASLIMHRGRPIGSVGVFTDLRARLQIEERLASAQQELADKEQKAFIAELAGATAHELNQPLTSVMGYAGMIARDAEEGSRLGRASNAIVRETERMAEIVRKIGKLTKYESKAYVGDTQIIDIERSIDSEPPVTGR
jgi:PAS domain S-box-containing protein